MAVSFSFSADQETENVFGSAMDYESDEEPSCGQPTALLEPPCRVDQEELVSEEICSLDWNNSDTMVDNEVLEVPKTPGRDEDESDSYGLSVYGEEFFVAEDHVEYDFDINAEIGSGPFGIVLEEEIDVSEETASEKESDSSDKDYIDDITGEKLAVCSLLKVLKTRRVNLNSRLRQDAIRNQWLKKLSKKRGPLKGIRTLRRQAKRVRNKRSRQMASWNNDKTTAGRGDCRVEFFDKVECS